MTAPSRSSSRHGAPRARTTTRRGGAVTCGPDVLAAANRRLASSFVGREMRTFFGTFGDDEHQELVACALVGLVEAAKTWDPGRGATLATWAWHWMRKECQRCLHRRPMIWIPIYLWRRRRENAAEWNALPSADVRLDADRRLDLIPAPDRTRENRDNRDTAAELLGCLSDRERYVIARRFGLDGEETATLSEIGQGIGLSRERTRQIEEQALAKMRRHADELRARTDALLHRRTA